MSQSSSRIAQLASIIASQTAVIDEHLTSKNLPQPSFEPDAPTEPIRESTSEVEKARKDVLEATIELNQLLDGPSRGFFPRSINFSPLAAVHRFRIPSHVPLDKPISYKDLAKLTSLKEMDLRRICRYTAVYHRVFQESTPGHVSHTAASKLLATNWLDGRVHHIMGMSWDECWPAFARVPEAISLMSEEPNVSGYALAHDTQGKSFFEYLENHPDRAKAFAGAMGSASAAGLKALAENFGWEALPKDSVVVDVGGSQGHVSVHLARKFEELKFVVQDLPTIIEAAKAANQIPEDVRERVELVPHDMFDPQSSPRGLEPSGVHEADEDKSSELSNGHGAGAGQPNIRAFLFRYVLHDWPDKYCVTILRNLIPALTKGAKVVIQEMLLPLPGTLRPLDEMQIRSMDAIMLSLFNSREREEEDWIQLFAEADKRFINFSATRIKEAPNTAIITAEWAG